MPEDDEPEEFDFEEFMQAIEEERRERREQVSYEWVETVREAGQLYCDLEDIEAVSDELELSDEEAHEALTVYRLIFEEPPEEVASKSSTAGRAYFSLEKDDERGVAEDEDEPIEDLVREYVGALYLQREIDDEPVGDPPEPSTPPMAFDMGDLVEELGDDFVPSMNSIFESGIAPRASDFLGGYKGLVVSDFMSDYARRTVADIIPSIVPQQGLIAGDFIEVINSQQKEMMQSAISASIPSTSIVNSIADIQLPESVIADLASIQPRVSTGADVGSTPTSSDTEDSVTAEASKTTVEAEPSEVTTTTEPPTSPDGATLDVTLPDSDASTSELVFETPALIVKAILSTGQARTWYTELPKGYQLSVASALLMSVSFSLTGNLAMASLSNALAPAVRQMIIEEETESNQ